ncbi:hypothetical protein K239x_53340 [Planctomycetes bacterium K23_9]|uniref:Uncharacterized protein n=1 Tax=Stieleria marina TaxID=1930275 RepID=A0A517P1R2_9BACT|nr:hypothetical protein K239x_53340 [Planctomycetes bacterium K23_9]
MLDKVGCSAGGGSDECVFMDDIVAQRIQRYLPEKTLENKFCKSRVRRLRSSGSDPFSEPLALATGIYPECEFI